MMSLADYESLRQNGVPAEESEECPPAAGRHRRTGGGERSTTDVGRMKIVFSSQASDDYLYWQHTDRKVLKRINDLVKEITRTPYEGTGKPEPLRHALAGYWSRRIDNNSDWFTGLREGRWSSHKFGITIEPAASLIFSSAKLAMPAACRPRLAQ